jgi:bacteriorhodopsin
VWGLQGSSRNFSVNTEVVTYGILDVLAKGAFGLVLLWSHRSVPETNVEVGGYWSQGLASEGGIRLDDDA